MTNPRPVELGLGPGPESKPEPEPGNKHDYESSRENEHSPEPGPKSASTSSRSASVRLSTGTEITLPLDYRQWSMASAVFSASLAQLRSILPASLAPVRVSPGRGAVTLFSATYDAAGPLAPYDELAVLPLVQPSAGATSPSTATPQSRSRSETRSVPESLGGSLARSLPLVELRALRGALSSPMRIDAYVHTMLVTTPEARALGVDVWGYPKDLADISTQESDQARRTTVAIDGQRVLTFRVDRARPRLQAVDLHAYTEADEQVRRGRIRTYGEWAFRPLADRAAVDLGSHPQARAIGQLELGSRPLLSVFAPRLRSRYYRSVPVSP